MALSLESYETSLMTLRLMRPSDRTTGVKFRPTPNFLNWICVWQIDGVPVQLKPAGTGNSPPARNFADSPEIAVRLGSASVRITPDCSIARSEAVIEPPCTGKVGVRFEFEIVWFCTENGLSELKFRTLLPIAMFEPFR